MKNKNVTSWIILFSIFFQFLVGLTYFNPNLGNKNNVDILDLEPSDVILGNYTFPGTSGPVYLNESIKIGLLGDLEDPTGDHNWKGALLAAKEINEGGGIDIYSNGTYYYVGLVAEDTDETNETLDVMKGVEAANKIISYDPHAIIGGNNNDSVSAYIEPIMDAKIPFLGTGNAANEFCQNVQNNYNRYKYFFRVSPLNSTMIGTDVLYQLAFTIINLNGTYDGWFKNVTVLRDNVSWTEGMSSAIKSSLPAIVSGITSGNIVLNTINEYNISTSVTYSEMTDIWNQVNRSMAQLVVPIFSSNASIIVSQTYGDVKPMCLMEGIDIASAIDDFWDNTEGGCQYEIMTHTLYDSSIPFFNDYVEEYNINPLYTAVGAYDAVYMLTNVSLSSQSLKADDIITGMEGFNRANPFIGPGGRIAFWDNTHELVAGYPYAYSRWCQWHLDGTKVVIPSSYSAYPPSIATGSLILPYWGIHNLVAPQDIPANFILSSYADPIDTDGTFELTWSNSTGADNYSVYLFDRNISYISKRYVLNSYENKTSPFTIFGLKTGEYYCIVAAYNETGERLSNTVYVNVERPRPGIFTLTIDADIPVDTDGDFILNWTVSEGADNYSIFESKSFITVINDSVTNIANQTTNTPLTITGLIDGDYFYAVMAYNETGERLSNNVFIKVRKPPGQFILSSDAEVPVGTDIFVDTDGNFNLTWTTSLRATNYTIFQSPNYITIINGNSTPIGIVQAINSSYEITGLNIGIYYYIIRAFNGYNYTISNCIEVNIQFYDAMTGYWELAPLVIEDTDNENFNWSEVVAFPWCSGSGTLGAPYIIEFIQIDGNNISDCITIIGSDVHFTLRNSSFFNGREGVLLEYVSNGELTCLNCSQNGGNGIDLEYCQNINIASCSVNNNTLNGIKLLNCNKISITYNVDTINYNKENGIHLEGSDNNTIIGNTIHHNTVNGIFLDEFSDNNFIDWNTFQGNGEPYYIAEGALNNVIGGNNKFLSGRVGRGEFPFDMIIILLIITVAVFGSIATAVIVKKRMSRVEKKEKEISEQKREKIRRKLEDKLKFVDHLIKERQIKLAYKNLGKIKDTADQYDFFAIFNTANRKVELVKDIEAGIYRAEPSEVQREVPRTPIASREESVMPGTTEEVREQIETTPLITRKKEKNINVFLSYSTLDVDRFQIERVANALGNTPEIKRVYYYVKDSGQNIVDYMEKTLRVCNTFVLFCTKHSKESKAVEGEWQAAYQLVKRDMMKIIPVYEDEEDVPILLITMLNVKYDRDDFNGFVNKLRQEILR